MEVIKATVDSVMQGLKKKKAAAPADEPQEWLKKVLTKKELGHIKFNYFKKGVINVNVDSSSWLYGLTLKKEELLEGLRKQSSKIKDIHFRIGETN